jgi:hypothetical protein
MSWRSMEKSSAHVRTPRSYATKATPHKLGLRHNDTLASPFCSWSCLANCRASRTSTTTPTHTTPAEDTLYLLSRHEVTMKLFSGVSTLLLAGLSVANALKFDLVAQPANSLKQKCIRNYVGAETLVVVTATLSGSKGDGQTVNIDVRQCLGTRWDGS